MKAADAHINKELFVQLAEGDVEAFRQIFHYYTARLHPFVFSIVKSQAVAEEIVQDVFLKLWNNRKDVAEKEDPSSWLFTVAANTSYTYIKRMSFRKKFIDHVKQSMQSNVSSFCNPTEDLLISKEGELLLHEAVEALPSQRKLIFLSRTNGLSHKEIARQLNISPNTVKNQLGSAIRAIREYLREAGAFFFSVLVLWLLLS